MLFNTTNGINRHRRVVYVMRRKILEGDNIKPEIERLPMSESSRIDNAANQRIIQNLSKNLPASFPVDEGKN
ncbi:hypothetical protein [Candidatus Minimicrobia naudis]